MISFHSLVALLAAHTHTDLVIEMYHSVSSVFLIYN